MRVEPSTRHGECPRFLQPLSPWLEKVTPMAFGYWLSGEASPKSQGCFHSKWYQQQISKDHFCHWHGRQRPCSAGQRGSTGHSHGSRRRSDFRKCVWPGDLIEAQGGKGRDAAGNAELQQVPQLAMQTQKVIVTFFSTKMSSYSSCKRKEEPPDMFSTLEWQGVLEGPCHASGNSRR